MYVQLANSTIQYPEGVVKKLLVRVKNSFVLSNFMVLDIVGDLGVQLSLGRPFLKDIKARIDAGVGFYPAAHRGVSPRW
jgi:hypothetical protein